MRSVEQVAIITQGGKFLEQSEAVYFTVHFEEKDGPVLFEQPLGSTKHFDFGSLGVALQKAGRRRCLLKIIQRNGLDLDGPGIAAVHDVTQAAVRRGVRIRACKKHGARFRPNGFLFDRNRGEMIALRVFAKALRNLGIRFEGHNAALCPDNPCGKE